MRVRLTTSEWVVCVFLLNAHKGRMTRELITAHHARCKVTISSREQAGRAVWASSSCSVPGGSARPRQTSECKYFYSTADLIHRIAAVFPRLRFLQLGHSTYSHGHEFCLYVRDVSVRNPIHLFFTSWSQESIPDAVERLPHLTDLRISLDFMERQIQGGPQESAARWLLRRLPHLCTVAFSWHQNFYYYRFPRVVWRVWDRSVLLRGPSPPPSVFEEGEEEEEEELGVPIPPWDQ